MRVHLQIGSVQSNNSCSYAVFQGKKIIAPPPTGPVQVYVDVGECQTAVMKLHMVYTVTHM